MPQTEKRILNFYIYANTYSVFNTDLNMGVYYRVRKIYDAPL